MFEKIFSIIFVVTQQFCYFLECRVAIVNGGIVVACLVWSREAAAADAIRAIGSAVGRGVAEWWARGAHTRAHPPRHLVPGGWTLAPLLAAPVAVGGRLLAAGEAPITHTTHFLNVQSEFMNAVFCTVFYDIEQNLIVRCRPNY